MLKSIFYAGCLSKDLSAKVAAAITHHKKMPQAIVNSPTDVLMLGNRMVKIRPREQGGAVLMSQHTEKGHTLIARLTKNILPGLNITKSRWGILKFNFVPIYKVETGAVAARCAYKDRNVTSELSPHDAKNRVVKILNMIKA